MRRSSRRTGSGRANKSPSAPAGPSVQSSQTEPPRAKSTPLTRQVSDKSRLACLDMTRNGRGRDSSILPCSVMASTGTCLRRDSSSSAWISLRSIPSCHQNLSQRFIQIESHSSGGPDKWGPGNSACRVFNCPVCGSRRAPTTLRVDPHSVRQPQAVAPSVSIRLPTLPQAGWRRPVLVNATERLRTDGEKGWDPTPNTAHAFLPTPRRPHFVDGLAAG